MGRRGPVSSSSSSSPSSTSSGRSGCPDLPQNSDAFRTVQGRPVGNTEAIAWLLYRDYLLPFEVASVFLLVAMIGAVVLGKRSMEKVD